MKKPRRIRFETIVEPHEDYPHLMAGPHRRRVARIGAPSLTRHLVFWRPLDWANYRIEDRPSRRRSLEIDEAIAGIYRTLLTLKERKTVRNLRTNGEIKSKGEKKQIVLFDSFMESASGDLLERQEKRNVTGPDAHRTVKLMFEWRDIATTIYFENHVEFVTATTVLDLSCEIKSKVRRKRLLSDQNSISFNLYHHLEDIAREQVGAAKDYDRVHDYLYRRAWKSFGDEVLNRLGEHAHNLGRAIADFRGLALGVNYDLRKEGGKAQHGDRVIARPLTRASTTGDKNTNTAFNPIWPRDEFDTIWKVLNCGISEEDTEITASQFLCGRAFYATALGEQSGVDTKPSPDPLYYLIYENTANMWQLGRLIYRINLAGTLRVVATMHFERLREVGGGLLQAGTALDRALSRPVPRDHGDDESIRKARHLVRGDYERVEKPIRGFASIRVDGPIYDRIERSRHYVAQFRQITKSLRIRRIEGFQPYDEFVHQKLGPVYEYIDRLGRRYEQVQRDRGLLFRRLQALDALYEERVISEAQYIADVALFGILGPYYVGSLATKIVHDPYDQHWIWLFMVTFGIASFVPITLLRLLSRVPTSRSRLSRAMMRSRAIKRALRSRAGRRLRGLQLGRRMSHALDPATRKTMRSLLIKVPVWLIRTRLRRVVVASVAAALVVLAAQRGFLPHWLSAPENEAPRQAGH